MKFHLIDYDLVRQRNMIAHGELLDLNVDAYQDTHDEVRQLLVSFTDQLMNLAVSRAFERNLT